MVARLQDTDRGYRALLERMGRAAAKPRTISMGIHATAGRSGLGGGRALGGDATHPAPPQAERAAVDEAVTVLMVAIWNEFGTDTIPARSFVRDWFDENEQRMRDELAVLLRSVVAGKREYDQVLELMGQRAVGEIQARIAAGIDPPNAASTVARKGSSTPLIDQGILRSSVTYKVDGQ